LNKLFVEPRHIRSGVGRVLLAHAVAEARQRGAERLTILADPNAPGFYERNGAVRIAEAPSDAVPGRLLPLYGLRLIPRRAVVTSGLTWAADPKRLSANRSRSGRSMSLRIRSG